MPLDEALNVDIDQRITVGLDGGCYGCAYHNGDGHQRISVGRRHESPRRHKPAMLPVNSEMHNCNLPILDSRSCIRREADVLHIHLALMQLMLQAKSIINIALWLLHASRDFGSRRLEAVVVK